MTLKCIMLSVCIVAAVYVYLYLLYFDVMFVYNKFFEEFGKINVLKYTTVGCEVCVGTVDV